MKNFILVLICLDIILSIVNMFLSREKAGEKAGWLCATIGWSVALRYFLLYAF